MKIESIIQACIEKNSKAEKELFAHYAPKVFALCRRYSVDDHQAKDFVQDCFIMLFKKLELFDPERGNFDSWMYRLCVNTILQDLRRQKKMIIYLHEEAIPETEIDRQEFSRITDEELLMAIRKLPNGYRNVVNLFVFENWTHQQIAELLGINVATSRSQYTRAKRLLKKILVETIPDIYERKLV